MVMDGTNDKLEFIRSVSESIKGDRNLPKQHFKLKE